MPNPLRFPSRSIRHLHFALAFLLLLILTPLAGAQTLTLADDIQTHATLTSTTVTVNGRSELRITGTGNPITGSTINLTGPDAWLRFTAIKPSAVNSTLLSQIRVSGANAVLNTNCRITQYGDGAVVIPHGSTFRPLEMFDGRSFMGESTTLLPYVAYSDSNFGLANRATSFRLKRGYTMTIAQNANGTGVSANYVAQDGDLEIALLPDDLNDSISFVRVFPWRWTTKKGIAGNIESGLNVSWDYNWNIDRNSALDREYVPIRQTRWWPSLTQNWQTRGANHLLGYNEPDSVDQANLPVGDAIWSWPDLLGTGLRVGSPAPTDGGLSWLYSFMDQANAAKLRVDFVAVHYYRCFNPADPQGAANQMYNFLKGVYDRTGRPLWITEWNNGANWTGCADPTATQQAFAVNAMMDMMEAAPFVERYALYNWVEDGRRVKWDDGSLTTAGVVYRDKLSALSHNQVIPEVATEPSAFYRFENNTRDSTASGHTAITRGAAKFTTGKSNRGLAMSGTAASGDHVLLPPRLGDSTDFTFGTWVYWNGGANWQRVIDLGNGGSQQYLFLTPSSDTGKIRFAIKNGGTEQQLNSATALPTNTWTHVAVTISGNTGKLFINGSLVATNASMTINPGDLATTTNYLGKSQFTADPLFAGTLDDVQILGKALTDLQVMAMTTNAPPQFLNTTITGSPATQGAPYSGTLAGTATDPGDTITYAKYSGPAWLSVAANGTLSGTPSFDDEGTHQFLITATDTAGATAIAQLSINMPVSNGNGTWTSNADGNWSDTTKWNAGFRANGEAFTADFSTLNISADRSVNLDHDRTLGGLKFGDTSGSQNWTLSSATHKTLTMAATAPSIAVNQNTATVALELAGSAGLNKTGTGTLVLAGYSSLTGILNMDSSSTTTNEGIVRLAHPGAAASFSTIQIRNNNSGASTLELDGTTSPVVSPAAITLSGRNTTVPAIRNVGGSNLLAGTLSIQSGGTNYRLESNAGQLELSGSADAAAGVAIRSIATGTRTVTLQGSANGWISGRIENGTADAVIVVKSGTGSWRLAAANTYTGTTTVSQGELIVDGTTGSGDTSVASGAVLKGNGTVKNNLLAQTGATIRVGSSVPPIQTDFLIDDFSGNLASAYTYARMLDQNGGVNNTSAWQTTGGSLRLNTTSYNAIEQSALTRNDAPLIVGDELRADYIHDQTGSQDIGLYVGAATPVANVRADYLNIYMRNDGTLYSRGFNGTTELALVSAGAVMPGSLFIARTGVSTFELGYYLGTSRVVVTTRTMSSSTIGNTIGIFSDIRAVGSRGSIDNLRRYDPDSTVIGPEKLTVQNQFTLSPGATLELDLFSQTKYDRMSIGGQFNASGTLRVLSNAGSPALQSGSTFDLFDSAGGTINFASIVLPSLSPGLEWNTTAISSGVITVTGTPQETYLIWSGGFTFPPGTSGPAADADLDGIANAFEWLFGTHPLAANPGALPKGGLRKVTASEFPGADPAKRYLSLTATVRKAIPGMTLFPQAASSPLALDAPGSSASIISTLLEDLGDFEKREWLHTAPVEDAKTGFMRLKLITE